VRRRSTWMPRVSLGPRTEAVCRSASQGSARSSDRRHSFPRDRRLPMSLLRQVAWPGALDRRDAVPEGDGPNQVVSASLSRVVFVNPQ
jgi:hypothetical protein